MTQIILGNEGWTLALACHKLQITLYGPLLSARLALTIKSNHDYTSGINVEFLSILKEPVTSHIVRLILPIDLLHQTLRQTDRQSSLSMFPQYRGASRFPIFSPAEASVVPPETWTVTWIVRTSSRLWSCQKLRRRWSWGSVRSKLLVDTRKVRLLSPWLLTDGLTRSSTRPSRLSDQDDYKWLYIIRNYFSEF